MVIGTRIVVSFTHWVLSKTTAFTRKVSDVEKVKPMEKGGDVETVEVCAKILFPVRL